MQKQNYLTAGLITILLISVLSISGCIKVQVPTGTSEGEAQSTGVGKGIPTSDVTGKDITNVPRYPGSIRTYAATVMGGDMIAYQTSVSVDTVAVFYEEQLPTKGWMIIASTIDPDLRGITATTKSGDYVTIAIAPSEEYSGYTAISIVSRNVMPPGVG